MRVICGKEGWVSRSPWIPPLHGYITPDLLSRVVLWPLVWVGKRMNECHHGQCWGGIRRGSKRQLAGFESTLL